MTGSSYQDLLEVLAVSGNRETERKVNSANKEIDFDTEPDPFGIYDDGLGGAEQVKKPDHGDERRVLEKGDESVDQRWDRGSQRLRQHDQDRGWPERQPHAGRSFVLAQWDGLKPGANYFRQIGSDKHHDRDQIGRAS